MILRILFLMTGVKSKAREQVLGYYDAPKSSGYAIFRAWFDGADIRKDPICAHLAAEGVDQKNVWIGPDVHFIASAYKKGKEFNWVMTHKVRFPSQSRRQLSQRRLSSTLTPKTI